MDTQELKQRRIAFDYAADLAQRQQRARQEGPAVLEMRHKREVRRLNRRALWLHVFCAVLWALLCVSVMEQIQLTAQLRTAQAQAATREAGRK